jgi:polysaccharide deacetylase family protein (PEP-CTERM system associated)
MGPAVIRCVLTFDIEDWFQVENLRPLFPVDRWDAMPRRVAVGTRTILGLLAEHGIRATFFVLGWIGEREPELVAEIAAAGHEIACHGYGHVLPTALTPRELEADLARARAVLERACGRPVVGYRAPSFALDGERLAVVARSGFRYDSSHQPFRWHDRYGRLDDLRPSAVPGVHRVGDLVELGLPVDQIGPVPLPASGGAYFRLFPALVFRTLVRRVIARRGHYVMYLHSWEFDPEQPRARGAGPTRTVRHYGGLRRTLPRMRRLLAMLHEMGAGFVTAGEFIDEIPATRGVA